MVSASKDSVTEADEFLILETRQSFYKMSSVVRRFPCCKNSAEIVRGMERGRPGGTNEPSKDAHTITTGPSVDM